ncbi:MULTISPECIES: hypothetical protein [Streptomyces]|nr:MULTISPECIES: hypothetical protein [Streptomyces]MBP5867311.1 hypothetical protein [Streptomyces sp. LBUM 1485]MBP5905953.1 hypothetical protein [Streptomyces sp. LBUM 1478]MBP5931512.1 hypothetical protein [Streptomyces sp. LBUM 1479]KFG03134.1 hypothetical protein IQ61_42580 [Streptomyces scabiei]MBP5916894.1 hypothetical protein [Streptomyces sp. LBUM 1486]
MTMKVRRFLAALGVAAAAGIVPVAAAGTAHADAFDCVEYLKDKGYRVGPVVTSACGYHSVIGFHPVCIVKLQDVGVRAGHANRACTLA